MVLVHLCMTSAFVDGMGYDENIMAKYHSKMGYEVYALSTRYVVTSDRKSRVSETAGLTNQYGVKIIYLDEGKRYGKLSQFGDFPLLFSSLQRINPDIIYVHNAQFISFLDVIKFCKKNRCVRLFVDNHDDYYNAPITTWKSVVLQKIIFRHLIRRSQKYVTQFWGVTPWRCQYLREVYRVRPDKIKLLVMGGDDEKIDFVNRLRIRNQIRERLGIEEDDFVITTGGKIGPAKNIHLLLEAVKELDNPKIKVIVFGNIEDAFREMIEPLLRHQSVRYVGWIEAEKAYDYFLSADMVCFPGTHSVLWEQACACGVPGIFKYWEGMQHVDLGGNAVFLHREDANEIKEILAGLFRDASSVMKMKAIAQEKGVSYFSYKRISAQAVGDSIE